MTFYPVELRSDFATLMSDTKKLSLIWGVEAISKLIGRAYQQTYHMFRPTIF